MTTLYNSLTEHADAIERLRDIGRQYHALGWSMGTSSNYSVVVQRDPLELLITASGKDKGRLGPEDFVLVDKQGQPTWSPQPASSAETRLHTALAADSHVGAVLHTHSIWGTLLSEFYFHPARHVAISGYEMLKGLAGITTHEASVAIHIFENTQQITTLADELTRLREDGEPSLQHGFLLRNHGLYTWGVDLDEARRHVEVLEFLFEVLGRKLSLTPPRTTG